MIACRRLRKLALSVTGLIGTLPVGLSQCRNLKTLQLGGNKIEGELPGEWFERLVNLEWLNLADNRLDGEIPSSLGKCVALKKLYLQGNKLSGKMPEIKRLVNLEHLMIFRNKLNGELPGELGLPMMQLLLAGGNAFTGEVPASLAVCGSRRTSAKGFKIDLAGSDLEFPEETKKLFEDHALTWEDETSLVVTRDEAKLGKLVEKAEQDLRDAVASVDVTLLEKAINDAKRLSGVDQAVLEKAESTLLKRSRLSETLPWQRATK